MLSKLKISFVTIFALSVFINSCHEQTKTEVNNDSLNVKKDTLVTKKADTANLPFFSGVNAKNYVKGLCEFGPRNPNSVGAKKALEYIKKEVSKYADAVNEQKFEYDGYDEKLKLTNLIATFNPAASKRILVCCHWDSRPRAEEDKNTSLQNKPILGANDGGSGVGVMLELARILKEQKPNIGVDLVFFDGEDYGKEGDLENYFLGARYFSKNLPTGYKPSFGVLLDLVGDKNSFFEMEANSMKYAPSVMAVLWNGAQDLGLTRFKHKLGNGISDDHLPLNEVANIPTIDIIDIEMVGNNSADPSRQYWHTHEDTLEKIGEESLSDVGRVLVYTIYRLVNN